MSKAYGLTARQHRDVGQTVRRAKGNGRRGRKQRQPRAGAGGGESTPADSAMPGVLAVVTSGASKASHSGDLAARTWKASDPTGTAVKLWWDGGDFSMKDVTNEYSTGTVIVSSGAVTLTGGSFPSWVDLSGPDPPTISFWIDTNPDEVFTVTGVTDSTHITLSDGSLSTSPGHDYKIYIEENQVTFRNAGKWGAPQAGDLILLYEVEVDPTVVDPPVPLYLGVLVESWPEAKNYSLFDDTKRQALVNAGGNPQFNGKDCEGNEVSV